MEFKRFYYYFLILCSVIFIFSAKDVYASNRIFSLEKITISEKSKNIDATILSFNENSFKTKETFHKLNDYVIYNLTIKNSSKTDYYLSLINDNLGPGNIEYEYIYTKGQEIKAKKTTTVQVKEIYKKELTDLSKRVQNQDIKIQLLAEDEAGNKVQNDLTVNPNTGINIIIVLILLGIISPLITKFAKNKKIGLVIVITILSMPLIAKALEASYIINVSKITNIYDKMILTVIVDGEEKEKIVPYDTVQSKPEDPQKEGYDFVGWFEGDEEYDFNNKVIKDTTIEARMTPIVYPITYDLNGGVLNGTNPNSYTIETKSFDLINPEKEGYTFSGWTGSNGDTLQTRVTIEKGSIGEKHYVANFSANQDTRYRVIHKYEKLDGGYEEETEELRGATDTTVTAPLRPRTGFKNPTQKQITITGNGNASVEYIYERERYRLTVNNREQVESNKENGEYPYGTQITLKANEKPHYEFKKWSNDKTTNPLNFELKEDTEIEAIYERTEYSVTFDKNNDNATGTMTDQWITKNISGTLSKNQYSLERI